MEANGESTIAQCLGFFALKKSSRVIFSSDIRFEKFFWLFVARIRFVAEKGPTQLLLLAYHSCLVVVVVVGVLGNQVEGVRTQARLQIALGA